MCALCCRCELASDPFIKVVHESTAHTSCSHKAKLQNYDSNDKERGQEKRKAGNSFRENDHWKDKDKD